MCDWGGQPLVVREDPDLTDSVVDVVYKRVAGRRRVLLASQVPQFGAPSRTEGDIEFGIFFRGAILQRRTTSRIIAYCVTSSNLTSPVVYRHV